MSRCLLAGLALVGSVLVAGCGDSPSCADFDSLTEQVAEADPDDADYNDLVNRLNQAQADCNSDSGY